MVYKGSKNKLAKYIVPIIQNYICSFSIDTYVEPFVGGANIIDKVQCKNKIGADLNEYLIALFNNKENVRSLPYITRELYNKVRKAYHNKDHSKYPEWFIGAAGFLASNNGRFFDGGYSGIRIEKNGKMRDYYLEHKDNFMKQLNNLNGIKFLYGSYEETCSHFENAVIYCDPPYKGVKKYTTGDFDYDKFWNWCRKMAKKNIVIVSEMTGPDDIKIIWEKEITRNVKYDKSMLVTEKLFLVEDK